MDEAAPATVVFSDLLHGYAVASIEVNYSGQDVSSALRGRILRTTDGGRRWTVVWQRRGIELNTITSVEGHLIVLGTSINRSGQASTPLLVTGKQGSWNATQPVAPRLSEVSQTVGPFAGLRLVFVTPTIGFAIPAPQTFPGPDPPLQTQDGGAHWSPFVLPGGSPDAVTVASPTTLFATGSTTPCAGEIWKSHTDGANWNPVPNTCEPFELTAVTFPTPQTGYAGGGFEVNVGAAPADAVLASEDGVAHWSRRWHNDDGERTGGQPFTSVAFATPLVGYALGGACVLSQNAPCAGVLWRTRDGGESWTPTDHRGYQLQVFGTDDLLILAGGATDTVDQSTDGGTTFRSSPLSP